MTREIKFRLVFKCKKTGQISFQIHTLDDLIKNEHHLYERFFDLTKDQYSGFKDKNGTEIYDQDIIKVPYEFYRMSRDVSWEGKDDGIEIICWDNEAGAFMAKDLRHVKTGIPIEHVTGRYIWVMHANEKSEIIANAHQNPELLKAAT